MSIEKGVLIACMSIVVFGAVYWFGDVISWGFTTIADCIGMGFDSACYSKTENDSVGGSNGPMWWPHE